MAPTRSSDDPQEKSELSPHPGTKRGADSGLSPNKKTKKQKTIEESLGAGEKNGESNDIKENEDIVMDEMEGDEVITKPITRNDEKKKQQEEGELTKGGEEGEKGENFIDKKEQNGGETTDQKHLQDGGRNAFDEVKGDVEEVHVVAKKDKDSKRQEVSNNDSVIQDEKRKENMPSSIMEKGIIYFFFRSRVNIEEPQGIEDIARSYMVLRPLPLGAKLGEGPLQDDGNARLIALPKKTLPKSKRDRFLTFVEQPKAHIKDLREKFSGSEYATKTAGTSNQPAASPFAEGIYALTSTRRESHLAYSITYPEIGEIQKELGLNSKGSYVLSVKNPKAPGPANATIDNPAEYPDHIQKKFRDLRWCPLEPEMLDYEGTQFLIIGEGLGDVEKALEVQKKDKTEKKETPEEELEKLIDEDHGRVDGLMKDDPVFADLGMSSKEFSKTQTTW